MQTFAKDQADGGAKAGGVIADAEAQATVYTERIAKLVVDAAENIGAGRRVGLGNVLRESFGVQPRVNLQMVADGERLLTTIGAAGGRLAIGLNDGAVEDDVQVAMRAVVVVDEHGRLLTVALQRGLGGGRELRFVLEADAGGQVVVVLFVEHDFAAKLNRAHTVRDVTAVLLVVEGGPVEVKAQARQRNVGQQGVDGLLIAGDALRVGIKAGFDLEGAFVLIPEALATVGRVGLRPKLWPGVGS